MMIILDVLSVYWCIHFRSHSPLCKVYTKKLVAFLSDKTVLNYFSEQNELFFNRMDRSIWPFRLILNPSTSLFGIFHVQLGGKHLSLQRLWTVNSGSIGVTRTSMCGCNRSVAASQAKCMFWLLTALKDDLFPERIWNVLFVIRK